MYFTSGDVGDSGQGGGGVSAGTDKEMGKGGCPGSEVESRQSDGPQKEPAAGDRGGSPTMTKC